MSKLARCAGVPALITVALAGCGKSSKSASTAGTATTPTSTITTPAVDSAVATQVPAKYKSAGTLTVATDARYAPNEFIGPDGHTLLGMDVDLVHALAAVMGLHADLVNVHSEAIIPGVAVGRYDMGASSLTDTKEREKTVDFVTYFTAGISFYSKESVFPGVSTIAGLCGKAVAVQTGTVEQQEATKQSLKCVKERRKAVTVLGLPGQDAIKVAVASGRAELAMVDSPVAEYEIKQNRGQFKLVGESYNLKPYGLAVAKGSGLAQPVLAALKQLIAERTYVQILTKWGIDSGRLENATIDGALG